jgi:hypothetical protein
LVAAGLIGADANADRYWHTDAGRTLYRQRMKRHGLFGWVAAIPPALRRLGEPQGSPWSLPRCAFDRAIKQEFMGLRPARRWVKLGTGVARRRRFGLVPCA